MEIELITTKKKLTSTILNQIQGADVEDVLAIADKENSIFGYIRFKNKTYFLCKLKDYMLIPNLPYSKERYPKKLKTEEEVCEFLLAYNMIKRQALSIHIYY